MSLGYIPSVERLRLPSRRVHPWALASWADQAVTDTTSAVRPSRRGLILDLDETLFPRERFVASGFAAVARHAAAAHGVPADVAFRVLSRARSGNARGHELQALCDHVGLPREQVPALLDVFRRHLPSIWLNHDVTDALHTMRAAGWRIGILTNGLPSVQFRKVAALGLTTLVDEVVYAEEHAAGGKPAAAAFRAVMSALDLTVDQCICVGDDLLRDVRGARALGIRTIRVARSCAAPAPGADADMVIDSLAQLPDAAGLILDMVTADVA